MVSFRKVANQRSGYHEWPGTRGTSNDGEKEGITNKKTIQKIPPTTTKKDNKNGSVYLEGLDFFFFHSQTQISSNSSVEDVFRPSCFIQPLRKTPFHPGHSKQEALIQLHSVSSELSKVKLTKAHRKMGWPRIPSFGQVGLKAQSSCDLGQ